MKLQNLVLPKYDVCSEQSLYYRYENVSKYQINSIEQIILRKNTSVHFDTYFNSFTIEKWKKYTIIGDIYLELEIKGKCKVTLYNYVDGIYKTINSVIIGNSEQQKYLIDYKLYEYKGLLTFYITALDNNVEIYSGSYNTYIEEDKLNNIKIALNICTYKREKYIYKTLDLLNKYIFSSEDSYLKNNLYVFISDNGQSLSKDKIKNENVFVFPNKNVGGAGGFTRGLIEIMHSKLNITHALMMDDDISIEPESIFRTFTLLQCCKEEYKEAFIGGAMLRIDKPSIQVESGASWNAGTLIPNKCNVDLEKSINVLNNEIEEYTEYNAWWYCCTPMSVVNKNNLPLPIFIRGDDLEYGLRNMKNLILLNGICVWHEPFENKYSSFLQYYILRNLLYDNTLHYKNYSKYSFLKQLYSFVLKELVFYRYKNIDLIFHGINDYLKGIKFFEIDGELLHKEIMNQGYKLIPIDQIKSIAFDKKIFDSSLQLKESRLHRYFRYITLNGYIFPAKKRKYKRIQTVHMGMCLPVHFYREKKVLNYDPTSGKGFVTERSLFNLLKYLLKLTYMSAKILIKFDYTKKKMSKDLKHVMTEEYWRKYLNI